MAKIEMDISEFKAMEENKKLLEDALGRERELADKVDKLNQEKIEILKQNEKTVTVIHKQQVYKMLKTPYSPHQVFEKMKRFFQDTLGSSKYTRPGMDYRDMTHAIRAEMSTRVDGEGHWQTLIDSIFETAEATSMIDKEVTRKGFDEEILEIKKEYHESLSKETKAQLSELESLIKENKSLHQDLKLKNKEIKNLEESFDRLTETLEKESENHISTKKSIKVFLKDLKQIVDSPFSIFSIKGYKNTVLDHLKKWQHED